MTISVRRFGSIPYGGTSMPPPIYAKAPPWRPPRSRYVHLFHGCTKEDESKIQASGIDLNQCRPDTDFGRGFYTTTVRYQAEQWAWLRLYDPAVAGVLHNRPVVLEFVVDRYDLAGLKSISFVLGDRSNDDFWSLVQHCRRSTPAAIRDHRGPVAMPNGTKWYDMACGPVAAFWRQKFAMQGADQFSFHTANGIQVLQQLISSGNKKYYKVKRVR